jgi:hypothetical protein
MIKTMVTVAVSFAALVALLLPHAPIKRISDLRPTSQDSSVILNDNLRRQLSATLVRMLQSSMRTGALPLRMERP